jgi:exosome complex protein LRP1
MARPSILNDIDKLEAQLDSLEEELEPMLENLPQLASQLPLLDRAKLYSLLNYAAGTVLFCEIPS